MRPFFRAAFPMLGLVVLLNASDARAEDKVAPATRVLAARSTVGPSMAISAGIVLITLVAPATLLLGAMANVSEDDEVEGPAPGVIGMSAVLATTGVIVLGLGAKRVRAIRQARAEVRRIEVAGFALTPGGAYLSARLRF